MDRGQIKKGSVRSRSQHLFENGLWCDCRFLVGKTSNREILEAHKIFLAMTSPVFEAMFFGSMPEKNDPVPIPDTPPESFKAFLKYIYTDKLELNCFEVARDLYYCANKYMIPDLVEKCSEYMQSSLSPARLWRVYALAELFEATELLEKCFEFMRTETKKILNDISWNSVAKANISVLFKQNVLAIDSEIELYDALLTWSKADCYKQYIREDQITLRTICGELLNEIRFLALTPEQFANGPGKGEILNKDEILALIMNISSVNTNIPIPQGFSSEKNHRLKPDSDKQVKSASSRTVFGQPNINKPQSSSRKVQRHFCQRLFASTSNFVNNDHLECTLAFRVHTSIQICGVRISAQLPINEELITFYSEKVYASLHNSDGTRLTDGRFDGQVRRKGVVNISFYKHVVIESDKDYQIRVMLNTPGTYPAGEGCAVTAYCAQVNFSFNVETSHRNIRGGLIRGIVFKK